MSKVSIKTQADNIVSSFAGTKEHDKIRAVRTFTNSDSAFVAWAKKGAFSIPAIRNARLIQQAWKRFGAARSLLITMRAIKAALVKLVSAEYHGKKTTQSVASVALALLEKLRAAPRAKSCACQQSAAAVFQQELFA